tara:strand:+ start:43 stop:492 length:450 start_codon:yes stop_codon:yes gene_type:complete
VAPQALTFVLELLSLDAVRFVCRRKGGAKLYAQGVACNFINNAVLGPPLYELVSNRWMSQPFTPLGRAAMVLAVIWGHSIGYYCSHRWMHTKRMYWAHKFHHKFNVVVVPVTRGTDTDPGPGPDPGLNPGADPGADPGPDPTPTLTPTR